MIVFSQTRKTAIAKMKAFIKENRYALNHHHFVLYSALRGQDVRKTSHMDDGMNAIDALIDLKSRVRSLEKSTPYFFRMMWNDDDTREPIFTATDVDWLSDVLNEAETITTLSYAANDGVNAMQASQRR